ncbi:uncharacterized protein LOC127848277 [Dreissena polymorpha]|uniref:Uncharacterized protein n=1 Tax=Dreissena polymorpha TaxID=45954 RepID=A0A9D4IAK0_DREPO|nr:uncharacterized protein LOC127847540 [Dreissena polymorpha]XP_052236608.1 uncharacterized protein LOC127848277 [Dreissena polymorpha]KAH3748516.1 hypothetical protein DPMN_182962 [Dreissena polymorpha]KAH3753008.1 hypothetical protein DPMN_187637 [Dreissena polymorpha]
MEQGTVAMFCLCFAIFCMVIAFASPYWVESFDKAHNPFVKCGLWEFCFNDYTFWKDYNGKRFLGCWYVFSEQYRSLWEWISPPWFIVCQVLISVSLLFMSVTCLIATLAYWRCLSMNLKSMVYKGAAIICSVCTICTLVALIVMGAKKEDRGWMPRPDQNYLSWSYGLACISAFFNLFGAVVFLKASSADTKPSY